MQPTINGKAYTFIGTTDEQRQCGCCGRDNLKGTIVLRPADGGEYVYFGSSCGARALGWGVKDVVSTAKAADVARRRAIEAAERAHPLQAVINAEIADANARGLRYAERRPMMARWAELRAQIVAEVAAGAVRRRRKGEGMDEARGADEIALVELIERAIDAGRGEEEDATGWTRREDLREATERALSILRANVSAAYRAGVLRAAEIAEAAENEEGSADERLGGLGARLREEAGG